MFDLKTNFSCVFVIIMAFVFEFSEEFFFRKSFIIKTRYGKLLFFYSKPAWVYFIDLICKVFEMDALVEFLRPLSIIW